MMDIAAASWGEILLRLILALVLGGLIGLERETVEKPAGLRTHTLVTLGAALFTLISKEGFFGSGAAPARIASNIVVGIGFLGAGTIWRSGVNVQGLTTAATLRTSAAIGPAPGARGPPPRRALLCPPPWARRPRGPPPAAGPPPEPRWVAAPGGAARRSSAL